MIVNDLVNTFTKMVLTVRAIRYRVCEWFRGNIYNNDCENG